jgi:hypothetical protein
MARLLVVLDLDIHLLLLVSGTAVCERFREASAWARSMRPGRSRSIAPRIDAVLVERMASI